MKVDFQFTSYFSETLGAKSVTVEIDQPQATLEDALAAYLQQNPDHRRIFDSHFFIQGRYQALFVCDGQILKPETDLRDGSTIKVIHPISGG